MNTNLPERRLLPGRCRRPADRPAGACRVAAAAGSARRASRRRGFIVLVVMIVIVMVTLTGLSFVLTLSLENKAVHRQGDQLQLDEGLTSGVELIKAFCSQPPQLRDEAGGTSDNAAVFGDIGLVVDEETESGWWLSITSPAESGAFSDTPQFGLQNESARLHLGALIQWEQDHPGSAIAALRQLPEMSEGMAAAILDWIDADGQLQPGGAETEYYAGQGLPYEPRNGVPALLEELLLVRDISREILLGPEAQLPFAESPDGASPGMSTMGGGTADLPWSHLLTVYSAERNLTSDGQPRINLNEPDLKKLHSQLAEALDQPWADFIIAFRQYGPTTEDVAPATAKGPRSTAPAARRRSLSRNSGPAADEVPLDLTLPAEIEIESLLDLVGAAVALPPQPEAMIDEPPRGWLSPLQDDPQALRDALPRLFDLTTTNDQPILVGRVNVNEAPRQVLLGIPGLEPTIVDRILTLRDTVTDAADLGRRHALWLLTESLVDRPTMKALVPYVTGGGDVFRAQITVRRSDSGRLARAEVVVDAAQSPPRQVYKKNLSLLGGRGGVSSDPSGQNREPGEPIAR
jgi:hypothetical protein